MTGVLVLLAAIFLLAMIALSRWANAQLPDGKVPVHFDLWGRATSYGSRWVVLGIMPASYVFMLLLVWTIGWLSGGEVPAGEILSGQLFLGFILLATHAFLVWLLLRWARDHPGR